MDFSEPQFKSVTAEVKGVGTGNFPSLPVNAKIVHIDITESGTAGETIIKCGGRTLAESYTNSHSIETAEVATSTCQIVKTGSDDAFVRLVYSTEASKEVAILSVALFLFAFISGFHLFTNYLKS